MDPERQQHLLQEIGSVRKKIANNKYLNEQNTKGALIEPVLRALGWDTTDPACVDREYSGKRGEGSVDYALMVGGKPPVFVEAKALGEDLERGVRQALGYAAALNIPFVFSSNGDGFVFHDRTGTSAEIERAIGTSSKLGFAEPER